MIYLNCTLCRRPGKRVWKPFKVCKDQKLKQSKLKFCPEDQIGKYLKLQIVKIQGEGLVNRVSSSFPNRTKNNMNTHKVKFHRNSDTKSREQNHNRINALELPGGLKYVLFPADKAANDIVVVCRLHYINT